MDRTNCETDPNSAGAALFGVRTTAPSRRPRIQSFFDADDTRSVVNAFDPIQSFLSLPPPFFWFSMCNNQ